MESGNGKVLDLELLLNQVGGIFKLDEDCQEEDVTSSTIGSSLQDEL